MSLTIHRPKPKVSFDCIAYRFDELYPHLTEPEKEKLREWLEARFSITKLRRDWKKFTDSAASDRTNGSYKPEITSREKLRVFMEGLKIRALNDIGKNINDNN